MAMAKTPSLTASTRALFKGARRSCCPGSGQRRLCSPSQNGLALALELCKCNRPARQRHQDCLPGPSDLGPVAPAPVHVGGLEPELARPLSRPKVGAAFRSEDHVEDGGECLRRDASWQPERPAHVLVVDDARPELRFSPE